MSHFTCLCQGNVEINKAETQIYKEKLSGSGILKLGLLKWIINLIIFMFKTSVP